MKSDQQIKHIDHALVAKGHTPMYVMHKFWARKPHNVVEEYIKKYSKEKDIVLDPFVGSGVTTIEAVKLGRKSIGIDLNPIAIFISRCSIMPVDIDKLKKTFDKIFKSIPSEVRELYITKCPHCKSEATIICTHWKNSKPVRIMYECKRCNKHDRKKLDGQDKSLIEKANKQKILYWYPTYTFPKGVTFDQARRTTKNIPGLFTKRNLIALSTIYDKIDGLPEKTKEESEIKELLKFTFTSMVHLASKLTPVRPSRLYSSFWAMNSYLGSSSIYGIKCP